MIHSGNLEHGFHIAAHAHCTFNPAVDQVISRTVNDKLVGGVIFQDFTGASIAMHVAGFNPRWINRDILSICFEYPFAQLNVSKVFGYVPAHNLRALEFNKKLGFKEEGILREVYPEGDLIVMAMRRETCRWLRLKDRLNG